jgi:hypothetical protein
MLMSLSKINRTLLEDWNARYEAGLKWRKEELCFDGRCELIRRFLKGMQWGEEKPSDYSSVHETEYITINLMGAYIRIDIPNLYSHNPIAKAKPTSRGYTSEPKPDPKIWAEIMNQLEIAGKTPEERSKYTIKDYDVLRLNSKLVEAGINDVLLELEDFNIEARQALKDAYSGIGVLKTHYEPKIGNNPKYGQALLNSLGEPVRDPDTGEEILDDLDEVVIGDKFNVERVDCLNIIVPVDSTPSSSALPWIIEKIDTTIGKVVDNEDYNADARAELKKNYKMRVDDDSKEWRDQKCKLLLVWDIENDEYLLYVKDGPMEDKAILRKIAISEGFPGIPGHPYTFLNFVISERFWPDPPYLFDAIGPQIQYNRLTTAILKIAEAYKPVMQVNLSALSDEGDYEKLKKNKLDYVKTEGVGEAIIPSRSVPLPDAILARLSGSKREFNEVVNQAEQARGVTGSANFAAEVQASEAHTRLASDHKRDLVSEFYSKTVKNIFYLLKANAEEGDDTVIRPVIVDVMNKTTGETTKVKLDLRRVHLDLEVDLKIDVVSRSSKQMGEDRMNMNEFLVSFNNNQELLANPAIRQRFIDMLGLDDELNNQVQRAIDKRLQQAQQIQQQQAQTAEKANQTKLQTDKMAQETKVAISQSEQDTKLKLQADKSNTDLMEALIGQMDKLPADVQAKLLLVIEPELNRVTNVVSITNSIEAKQRREEASSATQGKTETRQFATA